MVRDGSAHERKRVPRVALSNEVKTHLNRIRVLVSKCYDYFWCRTQVVRDGSAKPLCVGSNPIGTFYAPLRIQSAYYKGCSSLNSDTPIISTLGNGPIHSFTRELTSLIDEPVVKTSSMIIIFNCPLFNLSFNSSLS